ncbi:hypothetical protein [Pantoea sp. WEP]|uniref:hypothetical protein n=1 Tax=Pantoea sp. WEP TaxID=3230025 RepID=UPI003568D861
MNTMIVGGKFIGWVFHRRLLLILAQKSPLRLKPRYPAENRVKALRKLVGSFTLTPLASLRNPL